MNYAKENNIIISIDYIWGIMSSNRKYKYEAYLPEEKYASQKILKLKSLPGKKIEKKINFAKVFLLILFLCFIFYPIAEKIYHYAFINNLKNSTLKIDANNVFNRSEQLLANSMLVNRSFIGHVSSGKHAEMSQLELNNQMNTLKSNVQYVLNQYPYLKAGIFVWDYQTKNYLSINGDMQIPTASIIKVPLLIQMFKKIEAGDLSLYEKFKMTSYYRTGGSGYLQYKPEGVEFEMNDLAGLMIRTSDNTATNMILSAVGGVHEMNMVLRNWGFSKTYLKTWLPDLYGTNMTTPKDMATILYNADNPDFLSLENRSRIVEIMSKVKNTSLLKQGIPDSAQLIHKTGDIGEMLGDVGVVTMPDGRRYIITVMVKRRWNDYSARTLINQISSTVYNSFAANNL